MAWKKIDDEQTQADMPYSAFLANGLTTNANSYNNDMTRGGGIAWNATDPVTWSSFWNPQGVMFTVNVGQAVLQIDFRITYATLTASVDADGFQGIVFLQNMTSGELVRVGLLPTNGAVSYLDISLPLNAATTGPQAFSLCFQSSQLEDLGTVNVSGGVQNQIFLDEIPNQYAITQGEKHEILDLTGVPAPSAGEVSAQQLYQINYISTGAPDPPDGYASVYPSLVANPPRLQSTYGYVQNHVATVYELGAMTLLGIAFDAVSANLGTAAPQLSHATAGPLAAVISIQNNARAIVMPDLCNGVSQRYAFGAVIGSTSVFPNHLADTQSLSFSFLTNAAVDNLTLSVTFSYITLRQLGRPFTNLSLRDEAGALVVPVVQEQPYNFRSGRNAEIGITARDWYEPDAVAAWGMRDSMTVTEMTENESLVFNLQGLNLLPNKVYTVEIVPSSLSCLYVYNLYARMIVPIGSGV